MRGIRILMMGAALLWSLLLFAAPSADACSTFLIRDGEQFVYGRNFDFPLSGGYVMTNQRGLAKQALLRPSQGPARWVSRYGSVTFNQVSKEYPYGGMNEAGLVVENMWFEWSEYPAADGRAAVAELQWIQYQLDNCATVAEVLETDASVRIAPTGSPIHFFIADPSGDAATIEFIDGRMVVHRGEDLVVPALTNHSYDASMEYLRLHKGFGGSKEIRSTYESLDRFAVIASMLGDRGALRRSGAVDRAFKILGEVAQGKGTVWSAVYDMNRERINFKSVGNENVRIIDLKKLDFNCSAQPLVCDIEAPAKGDVTRRFESYSTELNRALVIHTFAAFREFEFMLEVNDQMQEYLAQYPGMFRCLEEAAAQTGNAGAAGPQGGR